MWSREKIYFNTDRYFASVIRAINAAHTSVDIEMYIFNLDPLGESILAALRRAVLKGVKVRLIIDGVGSPHWTGEQVRQMVAAGLNVRVYHPAPRPISKLFDSAWPSPTRALQLLLRLNRRNHKKLFIIDANRAFVGSMNVAIEHQTWRESSVYVEGADVKELAYFYDITWSRSFDFQASWLTNLTHRERFVGLPQGLVRTNITRKLRRHNNSELLARIHLARTRVWLTSAYFIPSPRIIRRLIFAAQRNVDVRLLLPRQSDVRIVRWVSMLFYQTLINANITIYEYLPSVLHAKTLIVDDWVTIGTSNLNHRSYYHDLEVDIVLKKINSIEQLNKQFLEDLEQSDQVTKDWLDSRPVLTWIAAYLASFLKWWM